MVYLQEKKDKIAYLRGMVRLSKIDKVVSEEESAYIEAAARGMGLTEKERAELNRLWTDDSAAELAFTSKGNAVFFIQEAIQLCSVDGHYDEQEQKEVHKIASEIGVGQADVAAIEAWTEEGILWRKRGEALIEEISARI